MFRNPRRLGVAGFTFVEVVIAGIILVVLMIIVMTLVIAGSREAQTQSSARTAELQCQQIVDQLTVDLRAADWLSLNSFPLGSEIPASPGTINTWRLYRGFTFNVIRNQRPTDPLTKGGAMDPFAGTPTMGGTITWEVVALDDNGAAPGGVDPLNGLDDDNDGLIDEVGIRRTYVWNDDGFDGIPGTADDGGVQTNVMMFTASATSQFPAGLPTGGTQMETPSLAGNIVPPGLQLWLREPGGPSTREPRFCVISTIQFVDARGQRLRRTLRTTVTCRNS